MKRVISEQDEEELDPDFQRAVEESIRVDQSRNMREVALNELYLEMCQNAKQARQRFNAVENQKYNEASPTLLSVDLILARLLKYVTLTTLAHLYSTSKAMSLLIDRVTKRFPITSICVESLTSFLWILKPHMHSGSLFLRMTETVHTIRFKIRHKTGSALSPTLYKKDYDPNIKCIILSIISQRELDWFNASVHTDRLRLVLYHEKAVFSDFYTPRIAYDAKGSCEEILDSIVDPRSLFFDALPNFTNTIEQQ